MLKPEAFLADIVACFGDHPPLSITLGGSYATGEQCCVSLHSREYWLSDFDLMCLDPVPYGEEETIGIYTRMWELGKRMPQANPYFHIGLKIRTPEEVLAEGLSMYYVELSHIGRRLRGPHFREVVGNIASFEAHPDLLNRKMIAWGTMRLWCNLLFLPIKALTYPQWVDGRIWYSYFVARGAMDWISWELIRNGCWQTTYRGRFEAWRETTAADEELVRVMEKCLRFRVGECCFDVQDIFAPLLDHANSELNRLLVGKLDRRDFFEIAFVRAMLHPIRTALGGKTDFRSLKEAEENLFWLRCSPIEFSEDTSWDFWHRLRCAYSDFRFNRSLGDRKDHIVYTKRFLEMGS